jgi:hypothetical protein
MTVGIRRSLRKNATGITVTLLRRLAGSADIISLLRSARSRVTLSWQERPGKKVKAKQKAKEER